MSQKERNHINSAIVLPNEYVAIIADQKFYIFFTPRCKHNTYLIH